METKRKFAITLARKRSAPGVGAMRCASSTWWRISRAQAWFSALMEAKSVATQMTPPEISWENAPRGEKASENSTTTRSAKNSMELIASRERHSMRRSLTRCDHRALVISRLPSRRRLHSPRSQKRDLGHPDASQYFLSSRRFALPLRVLGQRADNPLEKGSAEFPAHRRKR